MWGSSSRVLYHSIAANLLLRLPKPLYKKGAGNYRLVKLLIFFWIWWIFLSQNKHIINVGIVKVIFILILIWKTAVKLLKFTILLSTLYTHWHFFVCSKLLWQIKIYFSNNFLHHTLFFVQTFDIYKRKIEQSSLFTSCHHQRWTRCVWG